jgi:DNA-binding response OmpR family regulator
MAKGKILIVEDDHDIVEMVEYNLQEEGYVTVSALNGEDGVRLAGPDYSRYHAAGY